MGYKIGKKRIIAGALSCVMAISLTSAAVLPTMAQDTTVTYYANQAISEDVAVSAYQNVIYQGSNKSAEPIDGLYKYAEGLQELNNDGSSVNTARRFENDFYVQSLNTNNNVYLQLTGPDHEITEDLVCGGELQNPKQDPVPALAVNIGGRFVFLAGPYTVGSTNFYYVDGTYDPTAAAKQGAVGDGLLQGPEVKTVTDISVVYDPVAGALAPTDAYLSPGEEPGGVIVGPVPDLDGDGEMDYLETSATVNVYEVVDKGGASKQPRQYAYDKNTDGDNDPKTMPGNLVDAEKNAGSYYIKDSSINTPATDELRHTVEADGTVEKDIGVWPGPDGVFGTGDDRDAKRYDTDGDGVKDSWYADNGDNTFVLVKSDGTGDNDNVVGGGGDQNPATLPVRPIYIDPNTAKRYVGPVTDSTGKNVYYGDPLDGGNGMVDSTAGGAAVDDVRYYKNHDGALIPEGPTVGPVPDQNGDGEMDYLRPVDTKGVYEVVSQEGVGSQPIKYVFDKNMDGDDNPTTGVGNLVGAEDVPGNDGVAGGYYVANADLDAPSNPAIWNKVELSGTIDKNDGAWAGPDGIIGTADDTAAAYYDLDGNGANETWYADNRDNTFTPVKADGSADTANLVGGGGDQNPSTFPTKPIYTDSDTGRHYVGPVKDGEGKDVFYGDPEVGGNGTLDSTATAAAGDDVKYYVDPDTGKPTSEAPETAVTSLTLNAATLSLTLGGSEQLTATILPESSAGRTVTWTSGDPAVATVSTAGLVSAVAEGEAVITASVGGKRATCTVSVTDVTELTLNTSALTLSPGETGQLTATVLPESAAGRVTWTSNTPTVATVSADGLVTAVTEGAAIVTAAVGGMSANCDISVARGVDIGEISVRIPAGVTLPPRPTDKIPVSVWPLNLTFEADGYAWRLAGMDKNGNFLITTIDLPLGGELTMQVDKNGAPQTAKNAYYALAHYDQASGRYSKISSPFSTGTNLYRPDTKLGLAVDSIYSNYLITLWESRVIQKAKLHGITVEDYNSGYSEVDPSGSYVVFPMSVAEARDLMSVNGEEIDATRIGSISNQTAGSSWLRSPLPPGRGGTIIYENGQVGDVGSAVNIYNYVRPAMWVNLG